MTISNFDNNYDNTFVFANAINTYNIYSHLGKEYFLCIEETTSKSWFISQIGKAILIIHVCDKEKEEELILFKEFILKSACPFKFAYDNHSKIKKSNLKQQALLYKLQFEQIRRLSISLFIKAKAKKLEKQAFLYSNHEEEREM